MIAIAAAASIPARFVFLGLDLARVATDHLAAVSFIRARV
jgi:hypothetical protein